MQNNTSSQKKVYAIIVTSNDNNYLFDKKSLQEVNCVIKNRFSSGEAALDYLQYNYTNLVIVDISLKDTNAQDFIKSVAKSPNLEEIPIVVISSDSSREFVLEAIAAGCSGFVIRPYTLETLRNHLFYLVEIEKFCIVEEELLHEAENKVGWGQYDEAIMDFREIVESDQDSAKEYFEMGVNYLYENRYAKAIVAFKKALKMNNMFIKAYTGLAEAYKGKGDMEQYKHYMQKAADEYARINDFEEVKRIFVQILKYDENAPNPYNTLGIQLRKEEKYSLAMDAYKQALKLDPHDENIYYNFARALYYFNSIEKAVKCLEEALKLNSEFEEARGLYKKIMGRDWQE